MKDQREYIEREISGKGGKIFLIIYPHEDEIFVDIKALPDSAILCAMCDAISFVIAKVGSKKKKERSFVSIDWVINDWGGYKELVESFRKCKQLIMDDMPRMKALVQRLER